jgi:hypothetical protein
MHSAPDCFAELVLGRRLAPTRGLAMAARKYPMNLRTGTLVKLWAFGAFKGPKPCRERALRSAFHLGWPDRPNTGCCRDMRERGQGESAPHGGEPPAGVSSPV